MLVTRESLDDTCKQLLSQSKISIDCETTGLKPYQGSRAFALIIGTAHDIFYFNFNAEPDHRGELSPEVLPRASFSKILTPLVADPLRVAYLANAKFDMHTLAQEGITEWECTIHDVLVMDRLNYNDHMSYSLASVAKRHGMEKSDAVEEYIKEHKLWRWVAIPGKKKRDKDKFYWQVPFEVMFPYGGQDARITFDIGHRQRKDFLEKDWQPPRPSPFTPYETELHMTKVLYRMEREGVPVDAVLCEEMASSETTLYEAAAREFRDKTGIPLVDSAKNLSPLFHGAGLIPPKTEKGNDSFTDEWLATLNHPLAKLIQKYREHAKLANTYYRNFLWFRDDSGVLHANARQAGTRTGRLSYSDPNLQNVPDDHTRSAFLAPKDFCLVSLDWDQQEYKVMLEYAQQMDVIQEILGGLDVHEATAKTLGKERKPAKTLNFMLLYGGGVVKLALALFPVTVGEVELWVIWKEHMEWVLEPEEEAAAERVTDEMREANLPHLKAASELRDLYFKKLPKVEVWRDRVIAAGKSRGYVRSWTGREMQCKDKRFAYKLPNAIIQGGCSDVAKHAMIRIDNFLKPKKSKLLIQVHDELVVKVHKTELDIVPEMKRMMEEAFPHQYLKLTCSVSHSWKDWGSLVDGAPIVETTGNAIQGEGVERSAHA